MIQSQVTQNVYSIAAKQQPSLSIPDSVLIFSQAENQLLQSFCSLITPTEGMDPTSIEFKQIALLQSGKLSHFLSALIHSESASVPLIERLTEVQQKSKQIFYNYHQFICHLTNKNFAQIPLCLETAELLHKGLSLECQRYLSEKIQKALYSLDEDDLCRYALLAFQRLLVLPHQGPQCIFDRHILNAFKRLQETFPSMARELSARLQEELHADQGLKAELVCGRIAGSWHAHLLSILPENHLSLLRAALLSKLQRLLEMPHQTIVEWTPYQKLITLLQSLPGESREVFNNRLVRLGRKAFSTFEENIKAMSTDLSFFLEHQKNKFRREYIYRCAAFLCFFGSTDKKERLDKLVDQGFLLVQKSLIGNDINKAQSLVEWISPIMDLAANPSTKSHFQHVKKVLIQLPHLSEKQKIYQVIAPCALVSYFDMVKEEVEGELQRYPILSAENLGAIRESLSLHLQYYQLPYPVDILMSSLLAEKPSAFSWLRRSVCEKQEPYLLYGLLVLAKVLQMKHQWQERLAHKQPLPMVMPESIAEELIHFSQTLKHALQLGQGQLSRKIEESIHQIGEYFI